MYCGAVEPLRLLGSILCSRRNIDPLRLGSFPELAIERVRRVAPHSVKGKMSGCRFTVLEFRGHLVQGRRELLRDKVPG